MKFISFCIATSLVLWLNSPIFALALPVSPPAYVDQDSSIGLSGIPEFDFWREATALGEVCHTFALRILKEASQTYDDASYQIIGIQSDLQALVRSVEHFREQSLEPNGHINIDVLSAALTQELDKVFQSLQAPPNQAPGHEERKRRVEEVLKQVDLAVMRVLLSVGVSPGQVEKLMETTTPLIEAIIVTTGDLHELHPILLDVMVVAGSLLILPELPLIRPILSVFGFGPSGPVKGSLASKAQRFFYGGAVSRGSWFARLQQAGMTAGKSALSSIVFVVLLLLCCCHR